MTEQLDLFAGPVAYGWKNLGPIYPACWDSPPVRRGPILLGLTVQRTGFTRDGLEWSVVVSRFNDRKYHRDDRRRGYNRREIHASDRDDAAAIASRWWELAARHVADRIGSHSTRKGKSCVNS